MTSTVLLINSLFAVVAAVKIPRQGGIGTMYRGDCSFVNKWSTALHLVINILSSALLAGSNYTMQCLASPSRIEVDHVHALGKRLDIGMPSIRNILHGRVSKRRICAWWLLCLSSLPLHFLLNSAVFKSTSAASPVSIYLVGTGVLGHQNALNCNKFQTEDRTQDDSDEIEKCSILQALYSLLSTRNTSELPKMQKLENHECMSAYSNRYNTARGALILLTNDTRTRNDTGYIDYMVSTPGSLDKEPYYWMCANQSNDSTTVNSNYADAAHRNSSFWHGTNQTCDNGRMFSAYKSNSSNFTIEGYKIDYCLSQLIPQRCELQMSFQMLLIVIGCNRPTMLLKMVMMINAPQVVCSLLYFSYNYLLTVMLLSEEWSRYYLQHRPLRVSSPRGSQKSTYFLSLPYRYSIPLLIASSTLHWLVSQSLYLVRLKLFDPMDTSTPISHGGGGGIASRAGFSCPPMLAAVFVHIVMLVALVTVGRRKLVGHMPLSRQCMPASGDNPYSTDRTYLGNLWGSLRSPSPLLADGQMTTPMRHICQSAGASSNTGILKRPVTALSRARRSINRALYGAMNSHEGYTMRGT